MNDINIDKLERFCFIFKKQKISLYRLFYRLISILIYCLQLLLHYVVYRKWNNVSLGLAISLMVLGVI